LGKVRYRTPHRERVHAGAVDRGGRRPGRRRRARVRNVNVSQQVAGALGLAVLGTIATDHTRALELAHHPLTSSLLAGYHLAFAIGAASVAVGILAALILLHARRAGQPDDVLDRDRPDVRLPEPELEQQAA